MSVARPLAFLLVLAAVFGGAASLGWAVGPLERGAAADDEAGHGEAEEGEALAAMNGPAGLAVAEGGYRLDLVTRSLVAGSTQPFAFRILDEDGVPVRGYDLEHEREMHLIVVRRDLAEFVHVHPELGADGTWGVDLPVGDPGAYRVFADFTIDGEKHVLGADLVAPGIFEPAALPVPAVVARVGGYEVRISHGEVESGVEVPFEFTVYRGAKAVAVDPYLGARGHLVVLREGDLGYLHTHAEEDVLRFETTFPSAGRYRAFLQFSAGGRVRTAEFTLEVPR